MISLRLFVFALFVLGCAVQAKTKDDGAFLKRTLVGKWKEDQYTRKNLNNWLYEMGVNWFKRVYSTTAGWENTQDITFENEVWKFDTINGPKADRLKFDLYDDNRTFSVVDLGENLGGLTDATAEIIGSSLVTSLRKKGETDIYMTATRTINKDKPNEMIYEAKHFSTGVAMTSTYNRVV